MPHRPTGLLLARPHLPACTVAASPGLLPAPSLAQDTGTWPISLLAGLTGLTETQVALILAMGIAFTLLLVQVAQLRRERRYSGYLPTEGRVLDARLVQRPFPASPLLVVSFEYAVLGKRYHGRWVHPVGRKQERIPHARGETVVVHHDPDRPREAVLSPSPRPGRSVYPWLGLTLLVLAAAMTLLIRS